ncbi:carbon-nitrogen hydrolase family protein [Pseudomonas cichorii]|uniref:carbon-nitrogen hydrolase family protein n=1 Tax=Pseudomonas cichorii TaxID=36746 RepID=UPI001C8AE59E|nr:carbon-nitrogen hydrolase family protein [Pseudomonas cichorii]MBX8485739.1 carbon-nitrogen hydrolase family protein [Pseudomonas cichorii]MBX8495459.1 carbon-nitrogen hydrolase family protein [Pseudomonas cichorii]
MSSPILAAAQFQSLRGELEHNLNRHMLFMEDAADLGAQYLLFPELSLTGYEPDITHELALPSTDTRLEPLRAKAMQLRLATTVGVPLKGPANTVQIGALTFTAEGEVIAYAKQYLHPGESEVFSPGKSDCFLTLGARQIGLCVCADFSHPEHAQRAADGGAWVYAASVLISPTGYEHDVTLLQGHARRHALPVLMANHAGPTGGWQSVGRSGLWDESGNLVAGMPGAGEGLLVVSFTDQGWEGRVVMRES